MSLVFLDHYRLIETKLKRANGSPTIHYKLKIDVFLDSFKDYLQNGISINLRNQSKEIDDSLTESTTKNTTKNTEKSVLSDDNLAPHKITNFGEVRDFKDVNETLPEELEKRDSNSNVTKESVKITLPKDFQPSDDVLCKATFRFPKISARLVLEKFIGLSSPHLLSQLNGERFIVFHL